MPTQEKLLALVALQTDIVRQGLDLGGVMDLVVRRTLSLVDADGAAIEMAEGDEMVYRAVAGSASGCLGLRIDRGHSLSGLCVASGQVLRCDDAEQDARVDLAACRRAGLRSMLVVPLKHAGVSIGVLKAMSASPRHFDAKSETLLGLLAEVIGAAMYYSTRYGGDALFHRATHDSLTGLANRALFMDRLRAALLHSARDERPGALLMLDMDGLKHINDSQGHPAGDAALCALATRLKSWARNSDTVARLGGDEFAVLLRPLDGESGLAAALQRLQQQLAAADAGPAVRASFGAALFPAEASEPDVLIALADQRLYQHKRSRPAIAA